MGDLFALRHDDKWTVLACPADVVLQPQGSGTVPVACSTFGKGCDSDQTAKTVNATGTEVFSLESCLTTSYGHEQCTAGGAKVAGAYMGRCAPIQGREDVRVEGVPVTTHDTLFAVNNDNAVGFACRREVVVVNQVSKKTNIITRAMDLENMRRASARLAARRGAELFVPGTGTAEGATHVVYSGHRTGPAGPLNSDQILAKLDASGVDLSQVEELRIDTCGGIDEKYSTPLLAEELARSLAIRTGRPVRVVAAAELSSVDAEGRVEARGKAVDGEPSHLGRAPGEVAVTGFPDGSVGGGMSQPGTM